MKGQVAVSILASALCHNEQLAVIIEGSNTSLTPLPPPSNTQRTAHPSVTNPSKSGMHCRHSPGLIQVRHTAHRCMLLARVCEESVCVLGVDNGHSPSNRTSECHRELATQAAARGNARRRILGVQSAYQLRRSFPDKHRVMVRKTIRVGHWSTKETGDVIPRPCTSPLCNELRQRRVLKALLVVHQLGEIKLIAHAGFSSGHSSLGKRKKTIV